MSHLGWTWQHLMQAVNLVPNKKALAHLYSRGCLVHAKYLYGSCRTYPVVNLAPWKIQQKGFASPKQNIDLAPPPHYLLDRNLVSCTEREGESFKNDEREGKGQHGTPKDSHKKKLSLKDCSKRRYAGPGGASLGSQTQRTHPECEEVSALAQPAFWSQCILLFESPCSSPSSRIQQLSQRAVEEQKARLFDPRCQHQIGTAILTR